MTNITGYSMLKQPFMKASLQKLETLFLIRTDVEINSQDLASAKEAH